MPSQIRKVNDKGRIRRISPCKLSCAAKASGRKRGKVAGDASTCEFVPEGGIARAVLSSGGVNTTTSHRLCDEKFPTKSHLSSILGIGFMVDSVGCFDGGATPTGKSLGALDLTGRARQGCICIQLFLRFAVKLDIAIRLGRTL
jgi:hypothetical protein